MIGRDRVVALDTPSQMWSARWDRQKTAPRGVCSTLPAPTRYLAGDQEGDQDVGESAELAVPGDQVVLVAAVGVAGRVGVVLEQVDVAGDAVLAQPPLGVDHEALEDPLPGPVVDDQLADVVALGGGVLGVRADVEVQPSAVAQEDVARAAPGDDLAEQVAGHLVGGQLALALEAQVTPYSVSIPKIRRSISLL